MPVWTAAWPLVRRFGTPVLLWALRHVDPETVWTALQGRVDALAARRQAIRKAELTGGTFGAWIAGGRSRYVVFKDGEPIDAFPPIEGDLAAELRHYDHSRLRRPEELGISAARRRLEAALARLRRRERREDAPALAEGARSSVIDRLVGGLEPLLDELASAEPGRPAPGAPGVYLISDGGAPRAVGQSDDLARDLRDATAGEVRFVVIEDPVLRAVFEPYAAEALGIA